MGFVLLVTMLGATKDKPSSSGHTDSRGSNINVVVRLRPLNQKEQEDGTLPVVTSS
eukprot:COSAG05_NODE_21817_length_269_cov_0.605882_1_plen_55_part_01